MTETQATTTPGPLVFPPGRYGRRRAAQRRPWVAPVLAVLLVMVLSLISFRLYRMYGDPNYDAEVIAYSEVTDTQIVVDFRVTVPAGGSAICVLRARSWDHAEVGRTELRVTAAPGERHPTVRHRVTTTARPVIGEVLRCRPAD